MKEIGVQIKKVLPEFDASVSVRGESSHVYENICMVELMAYGSQLNKNITFFLNVNSILNNEITFRSRFKEKIKRSIDYTLNNCVFIFSKKSLLSRNYNKS